MIEIHCNCAAPASVPESMVGQSVTCPTCGQVTHIVAGEPLNMGAGAADFDAALVADGDGATATTKYLLGGTVDIQIGKLPDRHIVLTGPLVSRQHCRLVRVDFGPSCWKIVDTKSRNGVLVNLHRVAEHDLQDGDIVQIGESVFTYAVARPMAAALPAATASQPARAAVAAERDMTLGRPPRGLPTIGISAPRGPAGPAPVCPSCDKTLAPGAKICVDCGIKIKDGRPLLTSLGGDENRLAETARAWIQLISLIIRVTPMPIPLRSEAYGEHKPYAIRAIAILTTIVSIGFFCYTTSADANREGPQPGANLMLWSPWAGPPELGSAMMERVRDAARHLSGDDRDDLRQEFDPAGNMSDDDLVRLEVQKLLAARRGEFHWYQLVTHAFLHDNSSIFALAMHLGGNMLFLLVFGTRVNALLGNIVTVILYPILAIGAATVYLIATGENATGPMLGASGAIMGLAGAYLILFPVHRVVCAMWIRLGLFFRAAFACKIFSIRGFWFLLMYFAFDVVESAITPAGGGGVAHWAHIGGFVIGALVGLGVVFSRQFDTNGGDLLSVTLGKHAWPLIGKPSAWVLHRQTAGMIANKSSGAQRVA